MSKTPNDRGSATASALVFVLAIAAGHPPAAQAAAGRLEIAGVEDLVRGDVEPGCLSGALVIADCSPGL